jgi:hypothetical protein
MRQSSLQFSEPQPPKTNQGELGILAGLDLGVTFRDSLLQGAFGWYPYVEGFSAAYIQKVLEAYRPETVFDPFGGAGTTNLAASQLGIKSYYCEVNPFMDFVTQTKINSQKWALENKGKFRDVATNFIRQVEAPDFQTRSEKIDLSFYFEAFPDRDFFDESHLRQLLLSKELIEKLGDLSEERHAERLILLACSANVVKASHMTRRADLRRRRSDEYKNRVVDVPAFLASTVRRYLNDVESSSMRLVPTVKISDNALSVSEEFSSSFDFALTSPPYLNGTNYFRNTKLELWYAGFIKGEK